jgi:hypothetical protein
MRLKFGTVLVIMSLLHVLVSAQISTPTYTVTLAPFSSDRFDEFSPVYYDNGIVFCSNRKSGGLAQYTDAQGRASFNIFYVDTTLEVTWRSSVPFSENLSSRFNDGPVTFNRAGDIIYFSRNLRVDGSLRDLMVPSNKLGIFFAVKVGEVWQNIREYRFNSEWYHITTPWLSPDGMRLYFASDKPGGFGGSDLYYSEWRNGYWDDPVNLGPEVNTTGNESYPFINTAVELFFSSDGHQTLGGKDIFVTMEKASGWQTPVRLDEPVNSESDDFGFIMDPLMQEGYFSSDRDKTLDIYHFRQNRFPFWFSEPQKENKYCILVSDTGTIEVDAATLEFAWDFGDGVKVSGIDAVHCFDGPGEYRVELDLVDRRTGKVFFRKRSYDIEIIDIEQPYIESPDHFVAGEYFSFDASRSYCPGYEITGYYWYLGDGKEGSGRRFIHTYERSGTYEVKLGLLLRSEDTGDLIRRVVSKQVRVFANERERSEYLAANPSAAKEYFEITASDNIRVKSFYSAENDFREEALFRVLLRTAQESIPLTDSFFSKVPSHYKVWELFDKASGTFSYVVDQQMSLMAAYPAYRDMIAAGYGDAVVTLVLLRDPAEKELFNIVKRYGALTDSYFDGSNRLTTSANVVLDQIVTLMNKFPGTRLDVAVHTDNQGTQANNQAVSVFRAQLIVNYLTRWGIATGRLTATGYGGTRPVASNDYPTGRRLNRRIEFIIRN